MFPHKGRLTRIAHMTSCLKSFWQTHLPNVKATIPILIRVLELVLMILDLDYWMRGIIMPYPTIIIFYE